MNNMMEAALASAGVPQIDIPRTAFCAGLPENNVTNAHDLIFERGYCYRGFRNFPPYLREFDIAESKKVLLIRDPRDMLVSYYFSMAQSHFVPNAGVVREHLLRQRATATVADINDYCFSKIDFFKGEFRGYSGILGTEIRIFRYEDVIFRKAEWLADMLTYFDVELADSEIQRIAKANDIRPENERPGDHIRQVTPGNFRKHLTEETIERLNSAYAEELAVYCYQK
jgi:hypothetical protein